MGDPFKKVQSGQKLDIPAEVFNAFIDAARDYKMRQRDSLTGRAATTWKQTGIVLVRNGTGGDRARFEVLGLQSPIISPTDNLQEFTNTPTFVGIPPARELTDLGHMGRFAILQEPCAPQGIVPAVVSGVTVARVYVIADWHNKADVKDGDYSQLISDEVGSATILWKESGTGTRWAIVRLDDFIMDEFWARILWSQPIDWNKYRYQFEEVVKTNPEYGQWTVGGFGRSGSAYNSMEDPNDGQGEEGNGINLAGVPPGSVLAPIGNGAIVRMKELRLADGTREYWFSAPNELDIPMEPYGPYMTSVGVVTDIHWDAFQQCLYFRRTVIWLPSNWVGTEGDPDYFWCSSW